MAPYLERLLSFFDWLVETYPPTSETHRILVTTHGGPIKALIPLGLRDQRGYSCCDLKAKVPNCSVTIVEVGTSTAGTVSSFADVSWLGDVRLEMEAAGDAEAVEPNVAVNGR